MCMGFKTIKQCKGVLTLWLKKINQLGGQIQSLRCGCEASAIYWKFHSSLCPQSHILLSEVISSLNVQGISWKLFLKHSTVHAEAYWPWRCYFPQITAKKGRGRMKQWMFFRATEHTQVLQGAFWNMLLFQQPVLWPRIICCGDRRERLSQSSSK